LFLDLVTGKQLHFLLLFLGKFGGDVVELCLVKTMVLDGGRFLSEKFSNCDFRNNES
jgi:hypothetical protein